MAKLVDALCSGRSVRKDVSRTMRDSGHKAFSAIAEEAFLFRSVQACLQTRINKKDSSHEVAKRL